MKILYVTTISNTVNAFLIPHIRLLVEQGHQVDVAFNIVQELRPELTELGCVAYNIEFQRSPIKKHNVVAYKKLKKIILENKYDLVHTHTPVASACVRLACRKIKNLKVIYTAHGFHFAKGTHLRNWFLYYPIERWLAHYTDVLITINNEDYSRAKQSFKAREVAYTPGVGLNIDQFTGPGVDLRKKRTELGLPDDAVVVLSVGELNKNKNHAIVIKAIAELKNPNLYYVICGVGVLEAYLRDLAMRLGVEKQVMLLGYRKDVSEIYKVVDIFAMPSFREGLPVALLESMASGLPAVCSKIRGNTDLIQNDVGGFLVAPKDRVGFATAINKLVRDNSLRTSMGTMNAITVRQFSDEIVRSGMLEIYKRSFVGVSK